MSHQQSDGSSLVESVLSIINVLAQGHNAVTLVRLEPAAPRSRVENSTTEPLHSHPDQDRRKGYQQMFLMKEFCWRIQE